MCRWRLLVVNLAVVLAKRKMDFDEATACSTPKPPKAVMLKHQAVQFIVSDDREPNEEAIHDPGDFRLRDLPE
jgi:hypothetical protein